MTFGVASGFCTGRRTRFKSLRAHYRGGGPASREGRSRARKTRLHTTSEGKPDGGTGEDFRERGATHTGRARRSRCGDRNSAKRPGHPTWTRGRGCCDLPRRRTRCVWGNGNPDASSFWICRSQTAGGTGKTLGSIQRTLLLAGRRACSSDMAGLTGLEPATSTLTGWHSGTN